MIRCWAFCWARRGAAHLSFVGGSVNTRAFPLAQPSADGRISPPAERQSVNEYGARPIENNVQRCRILQGPAGIDRLAGDAQRELGSSAPLSSGPFPWITDGIDSWMFEPELAGGNAGM